MRPDRSRPSHHPPENQRTDPTPAKVGKADDQTQDPPAPTVVALPLVRGYSAAPLPVKAKMNRPAPA